MWWWSLKIVQNQITCISSSRPKAIAKPDWTIESLFEVPWVSHRQKHVCRMDYSVWTSVSSLCIADDPFCRTFPYQLPKLMKKIRSLVNSFRPTYLGFGFLRARLLNAANKAENSNRIYISLPLSCRGLPFQSRVWFDDFRDCALFTFNNVQGRVSRCSMNCWPTKNKLVIQPKPLLASTRHVF